AGGRGGLSWVGQVFATTYAAVDRDLPRLIAAHRPDAVLMFGLAARRRHVSIEVFARNRMSVWFPDAAGVLPPRAAIAAGAGASTRGRAAVSRLPAAPRAPRVKTSPSRGARKHLCHYGYLPPPGAAAAPRGP